MSGLINGGRNDDPFTNDIELSYKDIAKALWKKKLTKIVAILAAAGLTIGVVSCNSKNTNTNNDTDVKDASMSDGTIEDEDKLEDSSASQDTEDTNEEKEEDTLEATAGSELVEDEGYTFTDINDEAQVEERAEQIYEYFQKFAPYQDVSVEEIKEYLRYINGGVVEGEPTLDNAVEVIDQPNVMMVNELASAVDANNEVTTTREKNDVTIDYSMFFLDGTLGSQLAKKISDVRSEMILKSGTDISKEREEYAMLFMKSWILHGYNEINAYSLETSGMEAFIDLLFLNTASLAGDSNSLVIENPLTLEKISLTEILNQANYEDCPTQVVDEDGTVYEITLDKSTSDLLGMVSESAYTKSMYDTEYSLSLNK